MKNIKLLFLRVLLLCCPYFAFSQAFNITYPINGSVNQRDASGNTSISITGNVGYGYNDTTLYDHYMGVFQDDLYDGNPLPNGHSVYFKLKLVPIPGTSDVSVFNEYINLPPGWFEVLFWVRSKQGNDPVGGYGFKTHRFGIGDVYVIAGQSNAAGFVDGWDTGLINYDKGLVTENNGVSDNGELKIPQAVRVIGYAQRDHGNDYNYKLDDHVNQTMELQTLPMKRGFEKLTLNKPLNATPTQYGGKVAYDRPIFPVGAASWCWAPLGKKYIDQFNVPVQFYNVAIGGTSIAEWQKGHSKGLYDRLLNVLKIQANITGFRGILWHQGEDDATNNTSEASYRAGLQNLVNNIQADYDPNGTFWGTPISWYISRVSYYTKTNDNINYFQGPAQPQIIQAQNNATFNTSIKKDGVSTDDIGYNKRGGQKHIHFDGSIGSPSTLNVVGERWKNKLLSSLAAPKTIVPIGQLRYNFNNSTNKIVLIRDNDFPIDEIRWVKNEEGIDHPVGTSNNLEIPLNSAEPDIYTAYVRPQGRNYWLITQPFRVPNNKDRAPFIEIIGQQYTINSSSNAQFREVEVFSQNMTWSTSISGGNGWFSIAQNPSGGFGTNKLKFQLQANNSSSLRSAYVNVTGTNPQGQTMTKTINIHQTGAVSSGGGGAASLSLTSLTPTSATTGWADIHYDGLNCVGNDMYVQGIKFTQGIGTHVGSVIKYNIPSGYQYFTGKVGRDDGSDNCDCGQQKLVFSIKLNGVTKWTSNELGINNYAQDFSVPLNGQGGTLELIAGTGQDGNNFGDWADWINVYLSGSSGPGGTPTPPTNYSVSPASGVANSQRTLSATCNVGTVSWSTGQTGPSVTVSPSASTSYTVRCVSGSQQSDPRTVTAQVTNGSSPCSVLYNNLQMGVWTVTNHQLVTRSFHGQYWLTQKVNVNGSQYDEFVVRAGEMLQRSDVNLSNSSFSQLVDCYALKYSDYGGLLGPNHSSTVPFATPQGYYLYNASDGTPYYSTYGSPSTGGGGTGSGGPIANNGCYTIKSVVNGKYLQAVANDYNEFKAFNGASNQIWKFTTSDNTNWKVRTADGSGKYLYAEATNYCGAKIKRTTNSAQAHQTWHFDQNTGGGGTDFRFYTPNGENWNHEGGGELSKLEICGNNSQGYVYSRLFTLSSVGCPSGARVGSTETADESPREKELGLSVSPNPGSGYLNVTLYAESGGESLLELYDVLGRKHLGHSFQAQKGKNDIHLNATFAQPGTYYLQATVGSQKQNVRVVLR